jgi:hypothetical protein
MAVKINKPNPYAEHMVSTPVVATTTVHTKLNKGKGVPKEEKLMASENETLSKGTVIPADQLHLIEVGGGMTINLGNFESTRIDVRLTVPCTKDDLEEAYEFATNWVGEKIGKAVAEAKGQ